MHCASECVLQYVLQCELIVYRSVCFSVYYTCLISTWTDQNLEIWPEDALSPENLAHSDAYKHCKTQTWCKTVAACCSVLECVGVRWSALECVGVRCSEHACNIILAVHGVSNVSWAMVTANDSTGGRFGISMGLGKVSVYCSCHA